jgi:hypothetical protein
MMGRAARMAIMGVASAGTGSTLAHGVDGVLPGSEPVDVTGLSGSHIDSGSVMHHGPVDGGMQIDRPSTGYLAESSVSHGVEMEKGLDVSTIARDVDKAGSMTIDGQTYSVLDYMPGGDFVQMAAGSVNPAQLMMSLGQYGMKRQMESGAPGNVPASGASAGQSQSDAARGADGLPIEGASGERSPSEIARQARAGGHEAVAAARAAGHHVPDADENARDLERLALQHRLDLDTAVETSDSARVHTEVHAHGRTLEIDTDFEATARSNTEERAEAAEHVMETTHASLSETEHTRPDMRFRSKVQAHLDAAAQDQGLSI